MINDVIHEEQMENEEDMKTRGSILQNSPDQMKHNSSNMIRRESK